MRRRGRGLEEANLAQLRQVRENADPGNMNTAIMTRKLFIISQHTVATTAELTAAISA